MKYKYITGPLAVALIAIPLAACSSTSSSTTGSPSSTAATTSVAAAANAAKQQCEATGGTWIPSGNGSCQAEAAPVPATPTMTVSEQQAVDAAQEYLSDGTGFSDESLLNQLTSSYGNGFPQSDAKFAINYLHPDWDQQAVDAAKGYMQQGGFSRDSLISQLTSSYGNGFTYNQAVYAANQVGL